MYKGTILAEMGEVIPRCPAGASSEQSPVTTTPPRRARPRRKSAKAGLEDIAARAARLGITPEKVLEEYARIAFADVRHIAQWDEGGLHVKTSQGLTEEDAAPIHEISGGSGGGTVHVKLYDKKAALDAIARYLGMIPPAPKPRMQEEPGDLAEDAREVLKRELARLAARRGQE